MSKMAELDMEIRDLLHKGEYAERIARYLDVPVTWVYEVEEDEYQKQNPEVYNPFNTVNS
jgi:hypothetical protein